MYTGIEIQYSHCKSSFPQEESFDKQIKDKYSEERSKMLHL